MLNQNLKQKNSAQAYMVDSVLVVLQTSSVKFAKEKIIKEVESFDTISYIYVADKQNKLKGVLSIQELFAAKDTSLIKEVMTSDIYTVRRSTNKEKVALIALKHNLKAVPIVDKDGVFKGIVPSDEILSILNSTYLKDALLSAGIHSSDEPMRSITEASTSYHLKKRFPWLILGLSASMVTTLIVGSFSSLLKQQILLATFIPAITYLSDAVGNQTQTVFIKAMTLNNKVDVLFYFLRETKISIILGMILSAIVFLLSSFVWKLPMLSFIFSFALLMAIIGATVMAVVLPTILKKLRVDPAVATGPLASVIRDIYSLSIYLNFASFLLRRFS